MQKLDKCIAKVAEEMDTEATTLLKFQSSIP